jgi:pre-mRNA-splicing factor SYF1
LHIAFAKFYEQGGTTGEAEADLASARKVLEKATKVNLKNVEDLAEIWCAWAEMEVRHEWVALSIPCLENVLTTSQELRRRHPHHATCHRRAKKHEDQLPRSRTFHMTTTIA